jgi:hypothetical protein
VTAVSVIITAARPVAAIGKKLEHEIEQLHRLCDFHFGHWFDAPDPGMTKSAYHRPPRSASPLDYGKTRGSISDGSLSLTLPTRAPTGQEIMSSPGVGRQ